MELIPIVWVCVSKVMTKCSRMAGIILVSFYRIFQCNCRLQVMFLDEYSIEEINEWSYESSPA